jgi:hypothetical protein
MPHTFPVTWHVENPVTGFDTVVQGKRTPLITVQEAWQLLPNDHPRLFPDANLNYRGKLKPGQTVQAEVVTVYAKVAVCFSVKQKGQITFIHETIPNMVPWEEIHAHFAAIDRRIPPYSR